MNTARGRHPRTRAPRIIMPDPVPTSPAADHAAAAATLLAVGEVAVAATLADAQPTATEAERHLAARVAELEEALAVERGAAHR
jgi:hypothetical protein